MIKYLETVTEDEIVSDEIHWNYYYSEYIVQQSTQEKDSNWLYKGGMNG